MPKPIHLRQVTATMNRTDADKLERIAKARGYTLHAFLVRVLTNLAKRTDERPGADEPRQADANAEKLTETVVAELPVPLAQRLFSAARQMRDVKGDALDPTTLARMLLMHECVASTDILQQIEQHVDPDYVDIVGLANAKLRERNYKPFYLLVLRCAHDAKEAIKAAALNDDVSVNKYINHVLDAHLPELAEQAT